VKLSFKFAAATIIILATALSVTVVMITAREREIVHAEALRRAQTVLSFGEATRDYARYTLSPAVERHTDALIFEAQSATFVARGTFEYLRKHAPEYSFREASLNPLNLSNLADEDEKRVIEKFRANGALKEVNGYRNRNGRKEFYVARPIETKEVCLECHDSPETAPPEVVERYGRTHGFGWKTGDVSSAIMVSVPADDLLARYSGLIHSSGAAFALIAVLFMAAIPLIFHRLVGRRIRRASRIMEQVRETGELSEKIGDGSADELGRMCSLFDQLATQLMAEKEAIARHTRTLESIVEDRTRNLEEALSTAEVETKRHESAARALRESEERYRTILDNSLDAVVIADREGKITGWNARAWEIFGWTRDEASGRVLSELVLPARIRKTLDEELARAAATDRGAMIHQKTELTALHRTGREFPVELTIFTLHFTDGLSFCAFIRDISARKRIEEEERLAREAAEAASRLKSSFLANVSHEIRTPMTAIIGYTDLLKERFHGDAQAMEDLSTIERSGQHLLGLLNDILDLSKIESGQIEVELLECSIPELLDDVLAVMMVRAVEKNLSLQDLYETAIPQKILSDPTRIRQVLINLVGNAIKFTDAGSVVVSVRFVETGTPVKRLEIRVRDTGIGIPEEKIGQLFRPFTQIDPSTTRKYGGTGLGLSICYRLAQILGGELGVESKPGFGSLFTFTLGCKVPSGVQFVKKPSPQDSRRIITPSPLPRLDARILLVEDVPENQKLIRLQLSRAGASVDLAENGVVALEKCAVGSYDLILLDIQMPIMDGFQTLKLLREAEVDVPVIALTAKAMRGDRERCLAAGFAAYLSKPVTLEDLVVTALSVLEKARSGARTDSGPLM
jgi:PAS domain S-box-containing protein